MSINEEQNLDKRLKISKIDMTCDGKNNEIPKPLENYNFFSIIIGSPGSGKTNLWINLITKQRRFYYKKFDKIWIFSKSLHTLKNEIKLPKEQVFDDLNLLSLRNVLTETKQNYIEDNDFHTLIIFDDVINSIERNIKPFLDMIYNRRHSQISVILISQKFNKIPLELRSQCSSFFLFKLTKREFEDVYKDFITIDRKAFNSIINFIYDKKYNFMYYKRDTNEFYKNFNLISIT